MRKTIKHKVYNIEEKNKIVREYLKGEIGFTHCIKKDDLGSKSVLKRWISQISEYGTVLDGRGQSKLGGKPKGRKKKVNLNSLSKTELITIIEVYEDIKKMIAYLRQQKRSIKSFLS